MSEENNNILNDARDLKSKGRHELAEKLLYDFMIQNKDEAGIQRDIGLMFKEEFVDKRLKALEKGGKNSARVQHDIHRHRKLSESALMASIALEPENTDSLIGLAQLYVDWGRKGESFAQLRKVIEIDGYNAEAWWMLSDIYEQVNQQEYSEICMQNALCIGREDFGNVRRGYAEPAPGISFNRKDPATPSP